MKIEDKRYVLMKTGNMDIGEETVYFSNCDEKFTNDIRNALKIRKSYIGVVGKDRL